MAYEIKNQYGNVIISQDVIGRIAGNAAVCCYGLVGMARKKISEGVVELLKGEALQKGVVVKSVDNELVIDLYIVVSYGTKISEVAVNVMEQVRYAVESFTGLKVKAVNVIVQGVRVSE